MDQHGRGMHNVLNQLIPDKLIHASVMCMYSNEKYTFANDLSTIKWEPLYIVETCEEHYARLLILLAGYPLSRNHQCVKFV